jgi:hypothetical protein
MSKKYLPADSHSTIITNDLFLAAFLWTVGCTLDRIEKNERRRVSFVFVGERVRELREAYRTGPVRLDMRLFRESLFYIPRLIDGGLRLDPARQPPEQRSEPYPALPEQSYAGTYPMRLSQV